MSNVMNNAMSVADAVKGLAVLTTIPVIALALWAQYFESDIEQQSQEDPLFERETERSRARIAGVIALFVQFTLFVATTEIRHHAPLAAYLILIAAVVAQATIQAGVERKLRERKFEEFMPRPAHEMEIAIRAFIWATIGGALYIAGFVLPVLITIHVSKAMHFSTATTSIAVVVAAVLGMMGGLAINFALAPLYLSKVLPVRPIDNERLIATIEGCFTQAGLVSPTLWITDSGRTREATAMIAGFPSARGFFKPALFISRGMLNALTEEELKAVILHEVAHLKLKHLRRRLAYAVSLIFGTTACATFAVFLGILLAPQGEAKNLVGFIAATLAFLLTFRLLAAQSRMHESEADLHSVEKLGAGAAHLASALRRLDAVNDSDPMNRNPLAKVTGSSHPETDHRVELLEARFTSHSKSPEKQDKAA